MSTTEVLLIILPTLLLLHLLVMLVLQLHTLRFLNNLIHLHNHRNLNHMKMAIAVNPPLLSRAHRFQKI
jgi:hypothetical protein